MAELDNIPQTQKVEISTVKLDDDVLQTILDFNQQTNLLISDFGSIHIRKKEIQDELVKLDEVLERGEDEFKSVQFQLKELVDSLDEKYPQGRINLQDGTIQFQPGAPTRKQLQEQQSQQLKDAARQQGVAPQPSASAMKVVKE
jgi:predicted nuclease with TOPRIM domain